MSMNRKLQALLLSIIISLVMAAPTMATSINLSFSAAATALDLGPQDGVFDAFAPNNFGSVNNNGFTSFATGLQFNLAAIPVGSVINTATLSVSFGFVDGTRQIALYGYPGSGSIQLTDFSSGTLLGTTTVTTSVNHPLFNVTSFISNFTTGAKTFAGFNVREVPANTSNFLVMNMLNPGSLPVLSVNYSVPEPSTMWLLVPGIFVLWLWHKSRRGEQLT